MREHRKKSVHLPPIDSKPKQSSLEVALREKGSVASLRQLRIELDEAVTRTHLLRKSMQELQEINRVSKQEEERIQTESGTFHKVDSGFRERLGYSESRRSFAASSSSECKKTPKLTRNPIDISDKLSIKQLRAIVSSIGDEKSIVGTLPAIASKSSFVLECQEARDVKSGTWERI